MRWWIQACGVGFYLGVARNKPMDTKGLVYVYVYMQYTGLITCIHWLQLGDHDFLEFSTECPVIYDKKAHNE